MPNVILVIASADLPSTRLIRDVEPAQPTQTFSTAKVRIHRKPWLLVFNPSLRKNDGTVIYEKDNRHLGSKEESQSG